jgi:WD40 repeat protein
VGEPSAELALRELQVVLDEELQRLPARYRVPFVLCCLESKSRAEAAEELGWKEGTLASRLAHARKLLQRRLTRRGVTLTAALCASALAENATAAAVPATLAVTTARAAQAFAVGRMTAPVSATAAALAEGLLRRMFLSRVKLAVMLLALGLLTVTAGSAARRAQTAPTEEQPPAAEIAVRRDPAPPAPSRKDKYGDPLPQGVVARFGTLRLRQCGPVVFSSDGRHIITAGGESGRQVVFWDGQTGKELRRLPVGASILRLQLSPDGKRLAALTGTVLTNPVWDVAAGKILFSFKGEFGTFTRDGRYLFGIRNGADGPIIGRWEVATGQPAGEWTLPAGAQHTVRCSPDGKTAAYSLDKSLVLYDLEKKAERRRWPDGGMRSVAFSPEGRHLAAWSLRGLRLWDVASGRQELSWDRLVDSEVIYSADGKRLAWTGYDARSIPYPWVMEIGQPQPRRLGLPINNLSSQPAFAPDARTLAVNTDAKALELRDVATGQDVLPFDANTGRIFRVDLSPDGRYLAASDNFRVLVWDKAAGKLLRRFPEAAPAEPPMVWDIRLTADGQLKRGHDATSDGHWAEIGRDALARLQKLPLTNGRGQPAFANFEGSVQDVVESPGGRYLAVRLNDQPSGALGRMAKDVIRVWDTTTGLPLDHVQPPDGQLLGVFSPDNRLLVTTARRGTIHLWDLVTGAQRLRLQGHLAGSVRALLVTPDSRFLLSGGDDSQVLLWDLTGRASDGVWRTVKHGPSRQHELWGQLAGSDTATAHKAIWELAADPAGTVAFLTPRLKPVTVPSNPEISGLIADLGSSNFAKRAQAQAALRKIGDAVLPALRAARAKSSSLEQHLRLEKLVQELGSSVLTGDRLRSLRALEVLERIATADAQRLLTNLAQSPTVSRFTETARESLKRLKTR